MTYAPIRQHGYLGLPWPWPDEFRTAVEHLSRPFGPRPKRLLPPGPSEAVLAQVVSTPEELDQLLADRPPLWAWAVFASSLLQRRNAVVSRLRNCASGYHPRPGAPLTARAYANLARETTFGIVEKRRQVSDFMQSPAFTAVVDDVSARRPVDPNAILHVTNRLMDYHDGFLSVAERCLQAPIDPGATVLLKDTSALALCPLVSYDEFIVTLCHRVAEVRELLPYTHGREIEIGEAKLNLGFPRGLEERVRSQIARCAP
jgi:hypothetical protein